MYIKLCASHRQWISQCTRLVYGRYRANYNHRVMNNLIKTSKNSISFKCINALPLKGW